ncbi:hypothetical protein EDB84DRAFT_1525281 [Lactarius hengduanensis]|nr:hypothetical protein EDB84DRAFT_1525281 [Lactarius hengduanensis]
MRAALVRKAEGGGTGARLPICAPPGHAPPGPRAPRALTREGLPRGVSPWRTNPGDGGASAWLPVRVHPCARTRGRGGVSAPPPVRVCPSARIGEGGRRSGTERAPGSLALVSDAQGRGHRFCALPPRANPGRGGRCSRLERAPRACKRRRGAKGVGRTRSRPRARPSFACRLCAQTRAGGPPRRLWRCARGSPVRGGKGRCACVPPRRPASRALFVCKRGGGQRRGTYLSRAAPRSCASPPLRANGSGGGRGLSRVRIVRA